MRGVSAARGAGSVSGYLLPRDATALLARERSRLDRIEATLVNLHAPNAVLGERGHCEGPSQPAEFRVENPLQGLSPNTAGTFMDAFGAISESLSPDSALDVIEAILRRFGGANTPHRNDQVPSPLACRL